MSERLIHYQRNKHPEGRCFPFINHQVEPFWPKGQGESMLMSGTESSWLIRYQGNQQRGMPLMATLISNYNGNVLI